MRLRFCGGQLVSLLATALLVSAAWAAPSAGQADIAARKALELKQYGDVIKAYEGVDNQSLTEQALYRLAISYQRTGNAAAALNALDQALVKNPTGSFASTPARLASLRESINNALAKDSLAIVATKTAASAPSSSPAVLVAQPVEPIEPIKPIKPVALGAVDVVGVAPPVAAVPAPPAPEEPKFVAKVRDVQAAQPLKSPADSPKESSMLTYFVWLVSFLLVAAGVVAIVIRQNSVLKGLKQLSRDGDAALELYNTSAADALTTKGQLAVAEEALEQTLQCLQAREVMSDDDQSRIAELNSELAVFKSKPVSDVGDLVALRNELIKMRELIITAGTHNSLLFQAVETLEPLVAMEIGRNHFRLNRDVQMLVGADRDKLRAVLNLEPLPMGLDAADPRKVMSYITGGKERFLSILGVKQ